MHANVLEILLSVSFATAVVATAALFAAQVRWRTRLGNVVSKDVRAWSWRRVASLLCVVAAIVIALVAPVPREGMLLAALALAAVHALLAPDANDAVCGESGVRRGWYARSFADLEEWRLIGDHLRFRLFGEWTSAPLPRARHAPIRARLEELAGDRESAFRE